MDRRNFLAGLALLSAAGCMSRKSELTVGSKNFTEQLILGELLAQLLESACRRPVERRFYLAGTYICHQALLAGRIDMYVEYTGTALAAILKEHPSGDSAERVSTSEECVPAPVQSRRHAAAGFQQQLRHGHARG